MQDIDASAPNLSGIPNLHKAISPSDTADVSGVVVAKRKLYSGPNKGIRVVPQTLPGTLAQLWSVKVVSGTANSISISTANKLITLTLNFAASTTWATIRGIINARSGWTTEFFGGETGTSTLAGRSVDDVLPGGEGNFENGYNGTCIGIRFGAAGAITYRLAGDLENSVAQSFTAGDFLHGRVVRVYDTGTDAALDNALIGYFA